MKRACLYACLFCAPVFAAEPNAAGKEIPLDQIWAYDMPGTRDIRELEPAPFSGLTKQEIIRNSLVQRTVQSLSSRNWPKEGAQAGPAIMVQGTGRDALVNAQATLENKRKVTEKESARWLPANIDLSLLFYSYSCARYVRIASVERTETTIGSKTETQVTIHYQFVSHLSDNMSTHFALIPLGKVKPGAVRVTIRQIPPIDEFGREDTPFRNARRYVCESTSFGVK